MWRLRWLHEGLYVPLQFNPFLTARDAERKVYEGKSTVDPRLWYSMRAASHNESSFKAMQHSNMQDKMDATNIQAQKAGLNNVAIAEPVQAQERIEILDVIRGFALLGILIANMPSFNSPAHYFEVIGKDMWTGFWDTITYSFISLFIQGKFYVMFSFLFGLGFAIFYERAKAKTTRSILLFYRRLFILLLIGLVHAFFIWSGDILVTYALFGFLLPLFFNRKPKTLLIWAVALFCVLILWTALVIGLMALMNMVKEGTTVDIMQSVVTDMESRAESSLHAYSQGTFAEIMTQRTSDTLFALSQTLYVGLFMVFPLFLLGLYVGKRAVFQNIETNLTLIKTTWKWSLAIGLPMSIVQFICRNLMAADLFSFYSVLHTVAAIFGGTGLCLFFMTSIVLLCQDKKWSLKLKPLASMGRMSLSNYLLQSIICTAIFYSYGLGLYGKVGPALGLVLTLAIFTIQVFISTYWFKRYQFGPIEWVWRCFTYGKLFRMK